MFLNQTPKRFSSYLLGCLDTPQKKGVSREDNEDNHLTVMFLKL